MSSQFSKFTTSPVPKTDDIPVTPILETAEAVKEQNSPVPLKKKSTPLVSIFGNKLFLLGIFGVIMLVLAISLQLASRAPSTVEEPIASNAPEITGTDTLTTNWPLYQDPYQAYEIKIPPTWSASDYTTNIENIKAFTLKDGVRLELSVTKTAANSLTSYLENLDASRAKLWQGQPSRVISGTAPIRIGTYDGFERQELISATGVEYLTSYIMVDEDVFTFALIPTGVNKNIANQELIRELHSALTTFNVTNIQERQGEWKTYDSTKVASLSFPAFAISFPATWSIQDKKTENSLDLIISRNGYKISLSQAAVGGAVCLFKDSPSFQGSSGDLRTKEFTEYKTDPGYILRRYFKGNEGDNSVFLFCGKQESDQYFQAPLVVGGLTYTVPAKYDLGVIKEMDNIVKSIQSK